MWLYYVWYATVKVSNQNQHSCTPNAILDGLINVYSLLQSPLQSSISSTMQHHTSISKKFLWWKKRLHVESFYATVPIVPTISFKIINISRTVVVSIIGWRSISGVFLLILVYISGQLCVVYCGGGGGVDRRLKDTK